jgi:hypothetical protein
MVLIDYKKYKSPPGSHYWELDESTSVSARFIIQCSALSDHSSQNAKPEQYFPNTLGAILDCKQTRYTIGSTN